MSGDDRELRAGPRCATAGLAGLPMTRRPAGGGLPEQEQFGPFDKTITHLYLAAWHGSHSWGLHPVRCSFAICVNDDGDVAEACWCAESDRP